MKEEQIKARYGNRNPFKAPDGYRKDSGVYGFVIKDNPDYEKYEYYNGDTLKVRLYPEAASLNASVRFSGNYSLTDSQKEDINVILQKRTDEGSFVT